jgi:DNA-binding response OmpR family regulator
MASAGDRILLVENNPKISDLIARQTLIPTGYSVDVVVDSNSAVKQALLTHPDLIIADLNLPGLSAKDLLIALAAEGVNTPLLVIANKGQEQEIIQAFRLGAADYLLWPARDAEVLSAVERVLSRVHETRDRQRLDLKLNEMDRELQRRARELTEIINIGKAVVSTPEQRVLFQKIVDGALRISNANIVWLLIRDESSKQFLLIAQRGLPDVWSKRLNMPLDDGISGLVALSGETLSISGEPLLRFNVANLGSSACAVPIKIQKEVIGILVAVRKEAHAFENMEQILLEAVSGYAAIFLVNTRLFQALNNSAQATAEAEKRQNAALESVRNSVAEELRSAAHPIELLLTGKAGNLTDIQRQALQSARAALQRLARATEKNTPSVSIPLKKK